MGRLRCLRCHRHCDQLQSLPRRVEGVTGFTVMRVAVEETYPLRAKVLRNGGPPEAAKVEGDDHPEVATYAAVDADGVVVGCIGLFPEACPDLQDQSGRQWRIRGMATAEGLRGKGVGAQVLAAALGHVAAAGGGLVW